MHAERTRRSNTLEMRAAEYFGLQGEPRTSIKTGRHSCLIVARREPGWVVLATYNEHTRPQRCSYVAMPDEQAKALREALDAV